MLYQETNTRSLNQASENSEFVDSFPARLRALMELRKLSNTELAREAEVGTTALSNWLVGRNEPRDRDVINRLANALKVTPTLLWFGQSDNPEDLRIAELIRRRELTSSEPTRYEQQPPRNQIIEDPNAPIRSPVRKEVHGWGAVMDYLDPWRKAAERDPNVAPFMLVQLRKFLPHEDLKLFHGGGDE